MSITEWTAVIGVVLAVLFPVIRLLMKSATTLGTIDTRTVEIQKDLTNQRAHSQACSAEVHRRLNEHDIKIENHEGRLRQLEEIVE